MEMINYKMKAWETDVYQTSHFFKVERGNMAHIYSITQCPQQGLEQYSTIKHISISAAKQEYSL